MIEGEEDEISSINLEDRFIQVKCKGHIHQGWHRKSHLTTARTGSSQRGNSLVTVILSFPFHTSFPLVSTCCAQRKELQLLPLTSGTAAASQINVFQCCFYFFLSTFLSILKLSGCMRLQVADRKAKYPIK